MIALDTPDRAPIVVVGRSRSGTRIVAEALRRSGVFMGADVDRCFLDSMTWYQRFVVPLLVCGASRPPFDGRSEGAWERFVDERFQDSLLRHLQHGPVSPWGWKYPETLFFMTAIKARLAGARFVHVIRDGRDVVLSNGGYFHVTFFSLGNPRGWTPPAVPGTLAGDSAAAVPAQSWVPSYRQFCLAVTFGDWRVTAWRGIDLTDPGQIAEHKLLIQMQSWKRSIEWARTCAGPLEHDYHEIRYERLCLDPMRESGRLFDAIGIELSHEAAAYLSGAVHQESIGRWRRYPFTAAERRDFSAACDLGGRLLDDLGYGER